MKTNKDPSRKEPKLAKVLWLDAKDADEAWLDTEDIKKFSDKTVLIESYGFILSRTKEYLTMASDREVNDEFFGRVTKIPLRWIKEEKIV